ncbi:MAG: Wzz/FepE/Etk N-terminal domain-containing protein [Candidatus Dormibacteraeota bacterium]|nr:Wzz/FepE/Etk N-terminal domain-containing protein [Candidatus Dormibacteraeota bacterium]
MTVREYWQALRRRAWIPVTLASVAVLIAGGLTLLSRPQYSATASVIAKTQSNGVDKTLSFQDVATSRDVALRVRSVLNLREDVDTLAGSIKITGSQSNLYRVSVDDPDPARAVAIVNAVADQAVKLYTKLGSTDSSPTLAGEETMYRGQLDAAAAALFSFQAQHPDAETTSDQYVRTEFLRRQLDERVAEQAYVQFKSDLAKSQIDAAGGGQQSGAQVIDWGVARPDTLARVLRVVYAGAVGLVAGLGVILALEYLDSSIRDAAEAEQLIGAPVIGVIPRRDERALDA